MVLDLNESKSCDESEILYPRQHFSSSHFDSRAIDETQNEEAQGALPTFSENAHDRRIVPGTKYQDQPNVRNHLSHPFAQLASLINEDE